MSEEAMIRTVCSNCGMVYDLDSSLIGQFGECAECGAAFQITDQTDYVNQMLAAQAAQAAAEPEAAPEPVYEQAEAPVYEQPAEPEPAEAPVYEQPAEPEQPQDIPEQAAPQEGDVVMGQDDEAAPTNTVKLTRVSRAGMLPEVKDNPFKVGTINVSSQTVIGSTHGSRRFTTSRKFSSASRSTFTPKPKKKHWWEFWK